MNTRYITLLAGLTLLLLLGTGAYAIVYAPLNLAIHHAQADVICAGRLALVSSTSFDARGETETLLAMRVDRVAKGAVAPGTEIRIRLTRKRINGPIQQLTGYALVLLRRNGEDYTFSRGSFSSLPVSEKAYTIFEQTTDVSANLRWEMINSLRSDSPTALCAALRQTRILSVSDISQYVKPRIEDPDMTIRSIALAAALRAGDKAAVPKAIDLVIAQYEGRADVSAWDAADMRTALESMSVPPESVSVLAAALDSELLATREFVSFLLRRSRDWSTVPHLKRALADKEIAVRYNAVMGLAEITKDYEHAPAKSLYLESEAQYLNYWRTKPIQ